MKVSARLAQAEARAVWNAHMLPPRLTDTFRSQVPPPASPAAPPLRGSDQRSMPSRLVDRFTRWRNACSFTTAPARKPTPFEDSRRATPDRRGSAPAGTPSCYSRYDLARARVLFATHYEKPFDPSEHPRAQNGQFVKAGQGTAGTLSPLVKTGTTLRRMDSEETGTGMIWTIDGRPWELSEQDASDWRAITSRGSWAEGLNSVFPLFWTSVPEFEAEVRRKARSYRDRMLRVEGSAAAANPIDLDKRRSARAQAALQADFAELATTVDNATFLGGLAKAPLKAGVRAITKAAEARAAAALAAESVAETVEAAARTRTAIASRLTENASATSSTELATPPRISPLIADAMPEQSPTQVLGRADDPIHATHSGRPDTASFASYLNDAPIDEAAFADAWELRHSSITARLKEHLSHAVHQAQLSPSQVRDAMHSGRSSMHWGTQIDTRFKELVQNDVLLQGDIVVSPRRLPKGAAVPDVVDVRSKRWWDVTSTNTEFEKKLPKYGTQFGEGTSLLYSEF